MDQIKIGIIDNGICESYLFSSLQNNIYFDNEQLSFKNINDLCNQNNEFKHGTICALIIEKNCSNCLISSIKILDEFGKGRLEQISPALDWCLKNEIFLVNISFGSTHFADKSKMKKIIDVYVNKGMFIIAATENSEFKSYPASFSNVIGVEAGDSFSINKKLMLHKGIDFFFPVNSYIESKAGTLNISPCNSFAAPYITALAANVLLANPNIALPELKRKLVNIANNQHKETMVDAVKSISEITLPLIIIVADPIIKINHLLVVLKEKFANENYNLYVVSTLKENVLYNPKYIPYKRFLYDKKKVNDFLYWQSYYEQADAIMLGIYSQHCNMLNGYNQVADMTITISKRDNDFNVEILCDQLVKKKYSISTIDYNHLYVDIIESFLEENNEYKRCN